jgi:hypothetical protein
MHVKYRNHAKLVEEMLLSSVWLGQPLHVRVVWVGLLVMARPGQLADGTKVGIVYGTRAALANAIDVPLDLFEDALAILMAPDPNSTSKAFEGRRVIEAGPNLLAVVNYHKFRSLPDYEARNEKKRLAMRRLRDERRAQANTDVGPCYQMLPKLGNGNAKVHVAQVATKTPVTTGVTTPVTTCYQMLPKLGNGIVKLESAQVDTKGAVTTVLPRVTTTPQNCPSDPHLQENDSHETVITEKTAQNGQIEGAKMAHRESPTLFSTRSVTTVLGNILSTTVKDRKENVVQEKIQESGEIESREGCRGEERGRETRRMDATAEGELFDFSDEDVTLAESKPKTKASNGKSLSQASSLWVLAKGEKPVLVFPCKGTADEWPLSPRAYEWLKRQFPMLDVDAELRSALAWLMGNPERIKTFKGMPRYITNWLDNAARRPKTAFRPQPQPDQLFTPEEQEMLRRRREERKKQEGGIQ